jgi:acyl-[acyl-carrier-protein]-phospholipid O-acyltransferase/long-chain-fatty-acid--[acyl-carrier-protein] ligase
LATVTLPNLWKPDPRHFYRVEAMPLLGSGKQDMQKHRELAAALAKEA